MYIHNLTLNGNRVGIFSIFAPDGSNSKFENLSYTGFLYQGLLATQGTNSLLDVWGYANGENALIASDTAIMGQTEMESSTVGAELHVISGGGMISCLSCDANATYNIYVDGRVWRDWQATTAYTPFQIIIPTSNNAGSYAFEAANASASGESRPTFPQSPGATVTNGGLTFINIGVEAAANAIGSTVLYNVHVNDGAQSGVGGNVGIEAGSGNAPQIAVSNLYAAENVATTEPARALELIGLQDFNVSNIQWYGSNFAGSGADTGGIYIGGSSDGQISNFTALSSATTPLWITGSSWRIYASGINVNGVGSSGTTAANTYCIHIDTSNEISLAGVLCYGPTAWAHGIYDAGTNTSISDYKNYTTNAATDDSLSIAVKLAEDASGTQNESINGQYPAASVKANSFLIGANTVLPFGLAGDHGTGAKVQLSDGTGASGNLGKFASDRSVTDSSLAVTAVPQKVKTCGTTTTCSNTGHASPRIVWGTVTLSTGTATVASMTTFTSSTSFACIGTDATAAAAVKIVNATSSSIIITGRISSG
jgi:hypothetical protein